MSSKSMIEKDDLNTLHKKAAKYKKNIKTLNLVLKKIKNIVDYPAQHEIKTERDHLGKLYCQTKQKIYYQTPKLPKSRSLYRSPELVGRMVKVSNVTRNNIAIFDVHIGDIGYVLDSSRHNKNILIVEFPDKAGMLHDADGAFELEKLDFLSVPKECLEFVEE